MPLYIYTHIMYYMGAQKTGMDQVPYRCLNHGSRNIPISRCPKMGVPPHHDLINHLNVLKLQLFLGTSHFKKALLALGIIMVSQNKHLWIQLPMESFPINMEVSGWEHHLYPLVN